MEKRGRGTEWRVNMAKVQSWSMESENVLMRPIIPVLTTTTATTATNKGLIGWEGGSVFKNVCCSSRGPEFSSLHHCQVLTDSTPSSGLRGTGTHDIHSHKDSYLTHKEK